MDVETRYGIVSLTHHAAERWVERTGRTLEEFIEAVVLSHRPSKRELKRIIKRESFYPQRILMCECAYFILIKQRIVTVYERKERSGYHG